MYFWAQLHNGVHWAYCTKPGVTWRRSDRCHPLVGLLGAVWQGQVAP